MEADWSVELGAEMAVIDGHWSGWIDLRRVPERVVEIEEARQRPALGALLARLNAVESGYWTAKCDGWLVEGPVDPYEMECEAERCQAALGCYVDVLPVAAWRGLDEAERWAKQVVAELRARECRQSRVEVVLRRAVFAEEESVSGEILLGATVYLTGCGAEEREAERALAAAMETLAAALAGLRLAGPGLAGPGLAGLG